MKNIIYLFLIPSILSYYSIEFLKLYTKEVAQLKTESQKDTYWKTLYDLDQVTYMQDTDNPISGDSISLTNMMRTALMFEIHGNDIYKPNNTVPILNFSHSYIGDSNLAFWPIIQKCKSVGGIIESFGGQFPAYQLEGMSLTFYDYSLFYKASEYPRLLEKLNLRTYPKVSTALAKIYEEQQVLHALKDIKVMGKWRRQHLSGTDDQGTFEFVRMSDDDLYLRRKHRLQKLILINSDEHFKSYKIENEPFGWFYKLENGQLRLIDDQNNILITYNTYN